MKNSEVKLNCILVEVVKITRSNINTDRYKNEERRFFICSEDDLEIIRKQYNCDNDNDNDNDNNTDGFGTYFSVPVVISDCSIQHKITQSVVKLYGKANEKLSEYFAK